MRCDVCDTKIPPGSDTCPNCGYRIRKEHVKAHSQINTEYPEPVVFKRKQRKQRKQSATSFQDTSSHKALSFKGIVFVIVAILLLGKVVMYMVDRTISSNPEIFEQEETNVLKSFQEAIDDGDDDGTLQLAMDYEQDMENFFVQDLHLQDVNIMEDYYVYDDGLSASLYISGENGDYRQTLTLHFRQQQFVEQNLTLSWTNQESIREEHLSLNQDIMTKIKETLGIDVENYITSFAQKLVEDDDDSSRYVYSDYQDTWSLYFSETLSHQENQDTYVYMSISEDIK